MRTSSHLRVFKKRKIRLFVLILQCECTLVILVLHCPTQLVTSFFTLKLFGMHQNPGFPIINWRVAVEQYLPVTNDLVIDKACLSCVLYRLIWTLSNPFPCVLEFLCLILSMFRAATDLLYFSSRETFIACTAIAIKRFDKQLSLRPKKFQAICTFRNQLLMWNCLAYACLLYSYDMSSAR